jgi:hypothetical protein
VKIAMETVEVSDEQLVRIANVQDGKVSKRRATRNEAREFVWAEGADWELALHDQYAELTGEKADEDEACAIFPLAMAALESAPYS